MYPGSLADADCIVVQGSNMAENHPVAFRWVMQAKLKGAKIIHIDPRFTRTSAVADQYVPIRAGADIAFLGGLIRYVIENDRYFRDYVVNYTNAATIINASYRDTEDLDGVFSGLGEYTGDPINGFLGQYDNASWQYSRTTAGAQGEATSGTAQTGEQPVPAGQPGAPAALPTGPPYEALVRSLVQPPVERDPTLQDPRCVFQIIRRHYARYTPEADDRRSGSAPAAAREHGQTGRRNHGAARPRDDSGINRRADALPQHPRLHVGAKRAPPARLAAGLPAGRDAPNQLLG